MPAAGAGAGRRAASGACPTAGDHGGAGARHRHDRAVHQPRTHAARRRRGRLVEAARGALGHWLRVEGGRIAAYQIVAPTTWNFSPRDAAGQPGPLEAALEGAPVGAGETTPIAVQHIVRSFDPCMVCTVH
ncbi:MAG: nickel-dependent hydrogenase large subunit [Rhodobacteraceae bacterium]|nr:nickel-dependent hydrogenase large subunit [Paracoccaceae bacterium]